MAAPGGKEEKDMPKSTMQEVVEDDKNEISSCSSEVVSPVEQPKAKRNPSATNNELDCATDLNKLKADMDWINLQIEEETPLKKTATEGKSYSEKTETPAVSSSEASTPAPDVSPNELGEKAGYKKSKGNFEFPEGGWECSKC